MKPRDPYLKYRQIGAAILFTLFVIWRAMFLIDFSSGLVPAFGVSFTPFQAEYLGLDWRQTYRALLNELSVRNLRIAAYWNRIERAPGQYDFSELDFQMDEAVKVGAKVVIVVGRRLPRWPECHAPDWASGHSELAIQSQIFSLVENVVDRYKNHPGLKYWQVENEPFLTIFGICPKISREFVQNEIALVRQLDPNHPVFTTDSGELASWLRTAHLGDLFGTTMYRVVWHPVLGYVRHTNSIPASFYRLKAAVVVKPAQKVIISELQAEPWASEGLAETSIEEQFKSMDPGFFVQNIRFAQKTGFPEIYLWGAEWWYWLKLQGYPEHWQTARTLFEPQR